MKNPEVSVVVCTRNRADKLARCMEALAAQTAIGGAEVIVVDDGSTDHTASVAGTFAVRLIVNPGPNGLGHARNLGVSEAQAPLVAFTDDDCVPSRDWLERLVAAFEDRSVVAAGGRVEPLEVATVNHRYLEANNPLAPLEAELATSNSIPYRLWLYLRRNARFGNTGGGRPVYALPGATLVVRKSAIDAVGGFDPTIRFAGEDEDFCHRLRAAFPEGRLMFVPEAMVLHDYDPELFDTLRRSFRYGQGNVGNFGRHPELPPTVFPVPVVFGLLLAAGVRRPAALGLAAVLPLLASPRWGRLALERSSPEPLLFAYIQLLQEAAYDAGYGLGGLALAARRRAV